MNSRSVEVALEVPGTPEQVWEAIATGPGISAWFVPTKVEEGEGGRITQNHGADWDVAGEIVAWEPPHRLKYDAGDWQPAPEATTSRMAVEFLVEAQAGGTCVVRIVNSGFGSGPGWDTAFESVTGGWTMALENLRRYLTEFAGKTSSTIAVGQVADGSKEQAFAALKRGLGLADAVAGAHVASAPGTPSFAGVVERAGDEELLVRVEEPADGIVHVGVGGPGDQPFAVMRAYLYGDDAPAVAEREAPRWKAWIEEWAAA
jgi:uncharacterized protein YndB with AHSA1/START domain